MPGYSESRDILFTKFVDYRTACGLWNEGYGLNLLYFDRYCTEHFPDTDGLTQEMLNGWCVQRETENKTSLVGRTLPARKLAEYLNERGLAELSVPEMPPLPPKQYIPSSSLIVYSNVFISLSPPKLNSSFETRNKYRRLPRSHRQYLRFPLIPHRNCPWQRKFPRPEASAGRSCCPRRQSYLP